MVKSGKEFNELRTPRLDEWMPVFEAFRDQYEAERREIVLALVKVVPRDGISLDQHLSDLGRWEATLCDIVAQSKAAHEKAMGLAIMDAISSGYDGNALRDISKSMISAVTDWKEKCENVYKQLQTEKDSTRSRLSFLKSEHENDSSPHQK